MPSPDMPPRIYARHSMTLDDCGIWTTEKSEPSTPYVKETQLEMAEELLLASCRRYHNMSCVNGQIPFSQIEILTKMDMASMKSVLRKA